MLSVYMLRCVGHYLKLFFYFAAHQHCCENISPQVYHNAGDEHEALSEVSAPKGLRKSNGR